MNLVHEKEVTRKTPGINEEIYTTFQSPDPIKRPDLKQGLFIRKGKIVTQYLTQGT